MTHHLLVHGAWEGPWSWDYTKAAMQGRGLSVSTVDLHKEGGEDIFNASLERYVQHVEKALNELDGKVILVGHSMAGAVISQVAERLPEKIEKLVYIAAFLLGSGDSVLEAMQRDPGGEFLPELIFTEDQSSATAAEPSWRSKAFHDVSEARILEALPRLLGVPQATEPFIAKATLSEERFGAVPKAYVRTALDKMVSPTLQGEMLDNWKVDEVHSLQSGHFPTLSMPEKLAEVLA